MKLHASAHLFDGCIHGKFVGVFLGFTEHDGPAVAAAVNLDHIPDYSCTLRPVTGDGQMLERQTDREATVLAAVAHRHMTLSHTGTPPATFQSQPHSLNEGHFH